MNQKTRWAERALGLTQREPERPRDAQGRYVDVESYDPHGRLLSSQAPDFDAGARPGPVRAVDPIAQHASDLIEHLRGRRGEGTRR